MADATAGAMAAALASATATATAAPPSRLPMLTRLSVDDAARVLGLSTDTIKRRLKKGALRGERERTPSGFRWFVLLDRAAGDPATAGATAPAVASAMANGVAAAVAAATAATAAAVADPPESAGGPAMANGTVPPHPDRAPGGGETALLARQRAEEMARYSRELLAPYVAKIEAQATTIGRLEERTTHLQATVDAQAAELAALKAAPAVATSTTSTTNSQDAETQNGAAPFEGERRRWWQRLGGWLTASA